MAPPEVKLEVEEHAPNDGRNRGMLWDEKES